MRTSDARLAQVGIKYGPRTVEVYVGPHGPQENKAARGKSVSPQKSPAPPRSPSRGKGGSDAEKSSSSSSSSPAQKANPGTGMMQPKEVKSLLFRCPRHECGTCSYYYIKQTSQVRICRDFSKFESIWVSSY